MKGAKVGLLKQPNEVRLARLLEHLKRRRLHAEAWIDVLGSLALQALKRQLPDEKVCGHLEFADFPQSHSPGPVAAPLFDAARRRGCIATGGGIHRPADIRGNVLPRRALGTGHFEVGRGQPRLLRDAVSCRQLGRPEACKGAAEARQVLGVVRGAEVAAAAVLVRIGIAFSGQESHPPGKGRSYSAREHLQPSFLGRSSALSVGAVAGRAGEISGRPAQSREGGTCAGFYGAEGGTMVGDPGAGSNVIA